MRREYFAREDDFGSYFLGKTFSKVETRRYADAPSNGFYENDAVIFYDMNGEPAVVLMHDQECCESVMLEDVAGSLDDLAGSPITMAEERTEGKDHEYGSQTWTFYKFATVKGYVTMRFNGESNGYYSETVDIWTADRDD